MYRMRLSKRRWLRVCLYLLIFFIVLKIGRFVVTESERATPQTQRSNDPLYKEDGSWLLSIKASRTYEIPTVIVEEHYEVLRYWFQAVELDLIPKSQNVLLHIDAHVDGAVPADVDSIPWFRFPRNGDEIYRMMQRNDMFIVAAAVSGFIDHIIWVWPTWDEPNHGDEDWTYLKVNVEIGITQTSHSNDQSLKKSYLCACWTVADLQTQKHENNIKWKCHIRNTTCFEGRECPEISKVRCMIQSQVVLEVVSESVARSVLAKEKWPLDKGFILDIDEDFFGCWSDVIPLLKAGIVQENIDVLSNLVAYLFCVSTAEQEVMADRFYATIISLVKNLKSKSCAVLKELKKDTGCLRNVEIDNFFIENQDVIMNFLKAKHSSNIFFISEEKIGGLFFQSLLHFLMNFTLEQLDLLEQLGICLRISPGSPNFSTEGNMHVCHGDNTPNKTIISFYLPTKMEINFRAIKLKHILSSVVKAPNIITISRSIRDGYTPKLFHHLIESKLMYSIGKSYRKFNSSNVHFDSNLLGGIDGWNDRFQPWISELIKYFRLS